MSDEVAEIERRRGTDVIIRTLETHTMPRRTKLSELGRTHSVTHVAEFFCVNRDKVRRWIYDDELDAINVGSGSRPRWRITPEALEAFMSKRASQSESASRVNQVDE